MSEVPSIAQGISTQVMLLVLILQPLCHYFNAMSHVKILPYKASQTDWNISLIYSVLKHSKNFNTPKIKVETASLTPAVIQGILIAPRESKEERDSIHKIFSTALCN